MSEEMKKDRFAEPGKNIGGLSCLSLPQVITVEVTLLTRQALRCCRTNGT
jgi:hypothetical protein